MRPQIRVHPCSKKKRKKSRTGHPGSAMATSSPWPLSLPSPPSERWETRLCWPSSKTCSHTKPNNPTSSSEDMESVEVGESEMLGEEREDAGAMGESEDSTVYDVDRSVIETPVHGDDTEVGSNTLVIEEAPDVEDKCHKEEVKHHDVVGR
ncbi:hypothetical protein H0H93_016358 [Arthromyces matolae]|nr:hypothetical protein H0H93_016358 [Arthromyces matolae]